MWDAVERVTSFATQLPSELPDDESAAEAVAALVPLVKRGKSMAKRTGSIRQHSMADRRTAEQRLADTTIRMSQEKRVSHDLVVAPGSAVTASKAVIRSSMEGAAPPLASTVVTEENGNIVLSEIRIVTVDEKKDKGLANWPATGGQVLALFFWF
jgi:hypothetical protein